MTLASRRLMRKRPFTVLSLGLSRYAIGSEVAAETNNSAVMKAPAIAVTVWLAWLA
jgi:hypothetical protein